jgi:hypothetical protein
MDEAGGFAYQQVEPLLRRLGSVDLVLVGGQAVNFCAETYLPRVAELAASAPYTGKDIDFCGDRKAVSDCARGILAHLHIELQPVRGDLGPV